MVTTVTLWSFPLEPFCLTTCTIPLSSKEKDMALVELELSLLGVTAMYRTPYLPCTPI